MSFLTAQKCAEDREFDSAVYFKLLRSVSVSAPDEFEAGASFRYRLITDEHALNYYQAYMSIQSNDVVIRTYAPLEWVIKGKVKLGTGRTLQVKSIMPEKEVLSPLSSVVRYTIALG